MPPRSISKPMSTVESSENGLGNVRTPRRRAIVTPTPKNLSRAFRGEPFRPDPSLTIIKQQSGSQMRSESKRSGKKSASKKGVPEETPSQMLRQLSKFLANPLPQVQPSLNPRQPYPTYQSRSAGRPTATDVLSSKRKYVKTPANSSYVASLMSQEKKSVGKPGKATKDVMRNTETPQEMLRVLSRMPGFKPKIPSILVEDKMEEKNGEEIEEEEIEEEEIEEEEIEEEEIEEEEIEEEEDGKESKEIRQAVEAAQSFQTTEGEVLIDNNLNNEHEMYADIDEEIADDQKANENRRGNDLQESRSKQTMKEIEDFAESPKIYYEDNEGEKDLGDQQEMDVDDDNEYYEPEEGSSEIGSDNDIQMYPNIVKRRESGGIQLGFTAVNKNNSIGPPSSSRRLKHQTTYTRAKKPQFISKAGCPVPSLPNNLVKQLFETFSKAKVSREAIELVYEGTRTFFEQIAEDLAVYTEHGGRKVINQDDMICLFQRQRRISEKLSMESLAQRFLPRELSDEICTSALSNNVLVPTLKVQHA